jgi:NADH-quinone oxidoreductase subunit C
MADETKPNNTPPEGTQPSDKPAAEVKVTSPALPPTSPTTETKAAPPKPAVPAAGAAATPAKPAAPAKPAGPVPQPWEDEFVHGLKKAYGSGIREASTYLGQNYIVVDAAIVGEILSFYRNDEGFDYLVDLTAVHYPKREGA